ncbi:MAG: hypothetical protein AAGF84_10190 [Planctomycetota bacterium]
MKPIWNARSFGTTNAIASRFLVIALMLVSWILLLPIIVVSPYLVTVCAAWTKRPTAIWRSSVVAFLALAATLALLGSSWFVPSGIPLPLPADDPWFGTMPGLTTCIVALNALVAVGVALLPLAAVSSFWTFRHRAYGPSDGSAEKISEDA